MCCQKKKTMIMFGQRVSEKIGIKTSSLYSFYVWNIVGNGKQLYPIIFIESFYVINCCLSCYKSSSFKKHFVLILFTYSIISYYTKYLIRKIIRDIILKKIKSMSDSSFTLAIVRPKLQLWRFQFVNSFVWQQKRDNSEIELAMIHLCFKSFHWMWINVNWYKT